MPAANEEALTQAGFTRSHGRWSKRTPDALAYITQLDREPECWVLDLFIGNTPRGEDWCDSAEQCIDYYQKATK